MHTTGRLDDLLPQADFVFVAVPLTPETRNLLDARRQALMKRGAGLVNVGRAATVDYEALTANLRSGHLSGAVLDVFDPEPLPPGSPLWSAPNVIVTPHVSADDGDSYVPLTLELVFRNLDRLARREAARKRGAAGAWVLTKRDADSGACRARVELLLR